MCEEEPVPKLEGFELPSDDAAECGTHVGPCQHILGQTAREEVDIARRIIESGEHLPSVVWNVARCLIPGAGYLNATFLGIFYSS